MDEAQIPASDEDKEIADRRRKLKALRAEGVAYPNHHSRQNRCGDLSEKYEDADRDSLDIKPVVVKLAGRLMSNRSVAKASFATLQDMSGTITVYVTDSFPGKAEHNAFKQWDIGDIIGVDGVLFKMQEGNLAVRAKALRLLTKSLRPLPRGSYAKPNVPHSARYVDLIMNEATRLRFVQRSRIIQALRRVLLDRGFLEVETPILQPNIGGKVAAPFVTHHNALDTDFRVRATPDLYLKRLVVAGFEKVFELNRNFSNGHITASQASEFTTLALCVAYVEQGYLMWFIERMLKQVANDALGTSTVVYQGNEIDLAKEYERLTIPQAIEKYHPEYNAELLNSRDAIETKLNDLGATHSPSDDLGSLQVSLFEKTTQHLLAQPTFIVGYPAELSPLARRNDRNPETSERFKLYLARQQIADGFAGLNDPEDQAARFEQDGEADADYIRALEYGLPPTSGVAIDVDRVVMALTDSVSVHDVVLFPQWLPERSA